VTVFARYGAPSTCGSIKTRIWKRARWERWEYKLYCCSDTAEKCGTPIPVAVVTGVEYELNRQRNDCINGRNCRGIAVMCVPYEFCTDHEVK